MAPKRKPRLESIHRIEPGRGPALSLRLILVLFAALLGSCCKPTSSSSAVTFVQIPDVHLFDDGKPRNPNDPPAHALWKNDETALVWALDRIKRLKGVKFVVFTGDLGLEMTGPFWESRAVDYFAKKLSGLPVGHILFVPGNNDLLNEEPKDVGRYQHFVAELGKKLRQKVVDLSQASVDIDGIGVHGLNSGTFKNAVSCKIDFNPPPATATGSWTVVPYPGSPVQSLWCKKGDISDRLAYQADEMLRLANRVNKQPGKVQLLFTHIPPPPLPDPNSSLPNEPPPWNLDAPTLAMWQKHVLPLLTCVFAAHFHTDARSSYGVSGLHKGECDPEIVVSPPLAIKFQDDPKRVAQPARGYLQGTVTKAGKVGFEIVWYR